MWVLGKYRVCPIIASEATPLGNGLPGIKETDTNSRTKVFIFKHKDLTMNKNTN